MEQDAQWNRAAVISWLSKQIDTETMVIEDADNAENEYEYVYALGARDAFTSTLERILRGD
jgi:hypothetical protein